MADKPPEVGDSAMMRATWQSLLLAIVIGALCSTVIDTAVQYWRAPLGWSVRSSAGYLVVMSLLTFAGAFVAAFLIGLPVGMLLVRRGYFSAIPAVAIGAVVGLLTATIFSALGSTYQFAAGRAFWTSFVLDGLTGALIGWLWFVFERRRVLVSKHLA